MERIVYARGDAVLTSPEGLPYSVRGGQPWDAGDPLVRANPTMFSDHPQPEFVGTTGMPDWKRQRHAELERERLIEAGVRPELVEQATRAPGELRLGGRLRR